MNEAVGMFVWDMVKPEMIAGKRILEVGSRNVNGSMRSSIERHSPSEYIGIDIEAGDGVDMVLDASNIVNEFGMNSFDFILSLETMEHVENWRYYIMNMKRALRYNGHILLTTRSPGYPIHNYPSDHWRISLLNMQRVFSDMKIIRLVNDWTAKEHVWDGMTWVADPNDTSEFKHPGVFLLAQNCYASPFPESLQLSGIELDKPQ